MKKQWTIGALVTLAMLPLLWRGIEAFDTANADGITRARIDTNRVLARYEKSGDASEVRAWLVNSPGEAPTTQRDLTLAKWAQQNPAKFAAILGEMAARERDTLFKTFFPNLAQGGLDRAAFADAFRPHDSPAVAEMIGHLDEIMPPTE